MLNDKQVSTPIWIYLLFLIVIVLEFRFFVYNTYAKRNTTVSSCTEETNKSRFPEDSSLSNLSLSTFNDRCLFSAVGNVLSNNVVVSPWVLLNTPGICSVDRKYDLTSCLCYTVKTLTPWSSLYTYPPIATFGLTDRSTEW